MGILDGVRVLDFGRYITAPFCCQLLADMGADVIRVERPGGEADRQRGPVAANGQSLYFVALNRNKKDITLNLNSEKGRGLLRTLVKDTDVLVHNLPAPRVKALGLHYQGLREVNSRLVYLAVSGFGSNGPYSRYSAFDSVIQALSGATAMTGFPGHPPTLSHIPYMDFNTGLYGALAVTLALLDRERTGKGQSIDLAMFSAALSMVGSYGVLAEHAINGVPRSKVGNDLIYGVGGCYPTMDGNIILSVLADNLWRRLCKAIERLDLLDDSRFADDLARYDLREEINEAIKQWTMKHTVKEAANILAEAGIPVGQVNEVSQVSDHPQAKALDMVRTIEQPGLGPVLVSGIAMKFSDTPGEIRYPAPNLGQDNQEVYGRLLGPDALKKLTLDGVI